MKKTVLILTLLLSGTVLHAQDKFASLAFTLPPKWIALKSEQQLLLQKDRIAKGTCQITIFQSEPQTGSIETMFENEWNKLIPARLTELTGLPAIETINNGEWTVYSTSEFGKYNNQETFYGLLTYVHRKMTTSCVVLTDNESCLQEINSFISTIEPVINEKDSIQKNNPKGNTVRKNKRRVTKFRPGKGLRDSVM